MSQQQTQGLGGLSYKSTSDLSGTVSDVTNGNAIGTTYKNGIGLAVMADASNAKQIVITSTGGGGDIPIGVLQNNPKAGEAAQIQSVRGTSAKVICGGVSTAIIPGTKLKTDAYGRFVAAAAAGSGTAQVICAESMETPTAGGDLFEAVLLDSYLAA